MTDEQKKHGSYFRDDETFRKILESIIRDKRETLEALGRA
jgi:hypothetical protein